MSHQMTYWPVRASTWVRRMERVVEVMATNRLTLKPTNRLTLKPTNRLTLKPINRLTLKPINRLTLKPVNRLTVKPTNLLKPVLILIGYKQQRTQSRPKPTEKVCSRYSSRNPMKAQMKKTVHEIRRVTARQR